MHACMHACIYVYICMYVYIYHQAPGILAGGGGLNGRGRYFNCVQEPVKLKWVIRRYTECGRYFSHVERSRYLFFISTNQPKNLKCELYFELTVIRITNDH